MANLFTNLLDRLGPKALANRLNITERTARSLRISPLSRFPNVTKRARDLTRAIKVNTLTRAGLAPTEQKRFLSKSFSEVTNVGERVRALIDTIAVNSAEFKADRLGITNQQWISSFPEEFENLRSSIRGGVSLADRRLEEMERDSV